jgi:hypothetical protein
MNPSSRHCTVSKQYNSPSSPTIHSKPRKYREGYEDRMKSRQNQSSPHPKQGHGEKGPTRGPAHRPVGCGRDKWVRYMTGACNSLD